MDEKELINICLQLEDTYDDYPFGDGWAVMKHKSTGKWFACVFFRDGLCINVKCNPTEGDMWRRLFEDIMPAYHMNKEHWIMIKLGGDVPMDLVRGLVGGSYDLTKHNKTKSK